MRWSSEESFLVDSIAAIRGPTQSFCGETDVVDATSLVEADAERRREAQPDLLQVGIGGSFVLTGTEPDVSDVYDVSTIGEFDEGMERRYEAQFDSLQLVNVDEALLGDFGGSCLSSNLGALILTGVEHHMNNHQVSFCGASEIHDVTASGETDERNVRRYEGQVLSEEAGNVCLGYLEDRSLSLSLGSLTLAGVEGRIHNNQRSFCGESDIYDVTTIGEADERTERRFEAQCVGDYGGHSPPSNFGSLILTGVSGRTDRHQSSCGETDIYDVTTIGEADECTGRSHKEQLDSPQREELDEVHIDDIGGPSISNFRSVIPIRADAHSCGDTDVYDVTTIGEADEGAERRSEVQLDPWRLEPYDRSACGHKGILKLGLQGYIEQALVGGGSVTCLNLAESRMSDEGVAVLRETLLARKCVNLRRLDLSSADVGPVGLMEVGRIIRGFSTLEALVLSCNFLCGPEAFTSFCGALREASALRVLNLSHCGLTWRTLRPLVAVLRSPSHQLETLILAGNTLGAECAFELGEALHQNERLQALNLSAIALGMKGGVALATSIAKAAPRALRELRVDRNALEFGGCSAFARLWVRGLLPQLSLLDLRANRMPRARQEEVARIIGQIDKWTQPAGSRRVLLA